MQKHKWEQAWEDKKFEIKTLVPSVLVSKYSEELKPKDCVLDIGCGNGRNSIFLAELGCKVDCFDVMDLRWTEKLHIGLKERIHFQKSSILEYPYKVSQYRAVIVARVIQYLNQDEILFLFNKIQKGLKPDGFLLLSYTTKGGIFNRKEIDVPTYSYSIKQIESMLKGTFKNLVISEGSKTNKHVNYVDDILTYDIYASKPYN
jgi:2-polyprenyl-3-methyl-5-hydroxy-6-metoxy-1,4-benzoquinol methylase